MIGEFRCLRSDPNHLKENFLPNVYSLAGTRYPGAATPVVTSNDIAPEHDERTLRPAWVRFLLAWRDRCVRFSGITRASLVDILAATTSILTCELQATGFAIWWRGCEAIRDSRGRPTILRAKWLSNAPRARARHLDRSSASSEHLIGFHIRKSPILVVGRQHRLIWCDDVWIH
ncbi:hypothetical protein AAFG13_37435 [Bradyrhizobium sp. B124]|uniref:hypothetical protein n=1 Tax=Bradyrhizobium sp. B124 TaxID=3140245 RepID=UPI003183A129